MKRGEHTALLHAKATRSAKDVVHLWHSTQRSLCGHVYTPGSETTGDLCRGCMVAAERRARDTGGQRSSGYLHPTWGQRKRTRVGA